MLGPAFEGLLKITGKRHTDAKVQTVDLIIKEMIKIRMYSNERKFFYAVMNHTGSYDRPMTFGLQ